MGFTSLAFAGKINTNMCNIFSVVQCHRMSCASPRLEVLGGAAQWSLMAFGKREPPTRFLWRVAG